MWELGKDDAKREPSNSFTPNVNNPKVESSHLRSNGRKCSSSQFTNSAIGVSLAPTYQQPTNTHLHNNKKNGEEKVRNRPIFSPSVPPTIICPTFAFGKHTHKTGRNWLNVDVVVLCLAYILFVDIFRFAVCYVHVLEIDRQCFPLVKMGNNEWALNHTQLIIKKKKKKQQQQRQKRIGSWGGQLISINMVAIVYILYNFVCVCVCVVYDNNRLSEGTLTFTGKHSQFSWHTNMVNGNMMMKKENKAIQDCRLIVIGNV